jgi:uncharacterized protein (DUF2164 family)
MKIVFSRDEKDVIIPKIQKYCDEELEIKLGNFDAEFLMDFFIKLIGPNIHNHAIDDAKTLLRLKFSDVEDNLVELEMVTK